MINKAKPIILQSIGDKVRKKKQFQKQIYKSTFLYKRTFSVITLIKEQIIRHSFLRLYG